MKLELALLADYANKSADGKLNILGTFNRIWAARFPAVHQEMKLVLRFAVHPAETDQPMLLRIQLRTDDGRTTMEIEGEMRVHPPSPPFAGDLLQVDEIIGINGLPIPAPGRYEFVVLVNGEVRGSVPFTASIRQGMPPGKGGG